jgi:hypothetical protein
LGVSNYTEQYIRHAYADAGYKYEIHSISSCYFSCPNNKLAGKWPFIIQTTSWTRLGVRTLWYIVEWDYEPTPTCLGLEGLVVLVVVEWDYETYRT